MSVGKRVIAGLNEALMFEKGRAAGVREGMEAGLMLAWNIVQAQLAKTRSIDAQDRLREAAQDIQALIDQENT